MNSLFKATLTLTLLLLFLQYFQDLLLFKRNAIDEGQWWRLVSGSLVHSNTVHLLLNLAGLWTVVFLFYDKLSARMLLVSLFYLVILVGTGIYLFSPQLEWYVGLSGVLYGLFIIGAAASLRHRDYLIGVGVLLLVSAKLVWDSLSGGSQTTSELIGVAVATDAHWYGLIASLPLAAFLLFRPDSSSND